MLDAVINDNSEKAQVDFHSYLGGKMRETLQGEDGPADDDKNDD